MNDPAAAQPEAGLGVGAVELIAEVLSQSGSGQTAPGSTTGCLKPSADWRGCAGR